MKAVTKILTFLRALWGRGLLGKLAVLFILMFACAVVSTILNGGRGRTGSAARPAMPTRTPWTLPTAAPTATPEPTATAGPTATPAPTMSPKDAAQAAAAVVCGDRLLSAEYTTTKLGEGMVVMCKLADGISDESLAGKAAKDFEQIVRISFPLNPDLAFVTVVLKTDLKDKYGNVTNEPVLTFGMPATLYKKVNWDNFSTRDLVNLMHTDSEAAILVDPAMQGAWRKMWGH